MLDQLLETKQATQRTPIGTCVSVVLHVLVIGAAIQLTQRAASAYDKPEPVVVRIPLKQADPTPVVKKPVDAVAHIASALGSQVIRRVVDIPVDIPSVDVNATPTNLPDWTGTGVSGGTGTGTAGAPVATTSGEAFTAHDVEKVAAALPGSPSPAYPEMLKSAGVEGEAMVQFVVDTLGRAEPASFKVLQASHDAFGQAVRAALPRMRFLPAEIGGRKVRMLVQQTFAFALER
jgi:periplasmic protein TonB